MFLSRCKRRYFNAVLYGYALYYDLAAGREQKKIIATMLTV